MGFKEIIMNTINQITVTANTSLPVRKSVYRSDLEKLESTNLTPKQIDRVIDNLDFTGFIKPNKKAVSIDQINAITNKLCELYSNDQTSPEIKATCKTNLAIIFQKCKDYEKEFCRVFVHTLGILPVLIEVAKIGLTNASYVVGGRADRPEGKLLDEISVVKLIKAQIKILKTIKMQPLIEEILSNNQDPETNWHVYCSGMKNDEYYNEV
jgi:hypothetical protein